MENLSVAEIKILIFALSILIAVYGAIGLVRKKIWIGPGINKFSELHTGKSAVYWGILYLLVSTIVIGAVLFIN